MMLTFFAGRGGAGVVIDGCIRDSAEAAKLDIGIWVKGVTPNYHAQTNIIPFAVNVPIACANVLVIPGDIIVADDDGVVFVPIGLAPKLLGDRRRACRVGGVLPYAAFRGRRPAKVLSAERRGRGGIQGLAQGPAVTSSAAPSQGAWPVRPHVGAGAASCGCTASRSAAVIG